MTKEQTDNKKYTIISPDEPVIIPDVFKYTLFNDVMEAKLKKDCEWLKKQQIDGVHINEICRIIEAFIEENLNVASDYFAQEFYCIPRDCNSGEKILEFSEIMDMPYLTYQTEDEVLGYMREIFICTVNLHGGEDSYKKLWFIYQFLLYIMNENRRIRHKIEDFI